MDHGSLGHVEYIVKRRKNSYLRSPKTETQLFWTGGSECQGNEGASYFLAPLRCGGAHEQRAHASPRDGCISAAVKC